MQEEKLMFSNCTIINGELFFVETQYGLPAKMNLDTGVVSYCDIMENFTLKDGDRLIYSRHLYNNKLYALAMSGENVIILDLEKLQWQYLPLRCAYQAWGNFVAFEQYGSEFFIFPRLENKVCILNVDNNEIMEITDYFDGIKELQCACRIDNKVWILPQDKCIIGFYDLDTKEMKSYELGKKLDNCIDAVCVKERIYILNRFGVIYIWNISKRILEIERNLEAEYCEEKSLYMRIIYAGDKLIILPSLGEHIKILDLKDGKIGIYQDYPDDFLYYYNNVYEKWSKYVGLCEDDSYYYVAMRRSNYMMKINKQDGALSWMKPNIPSKEERIKIQYPLEEKRMENVFASREKFCLEQERDLDRFLNRVCRNQSIFQNTNVGKIVFEEVTEGLSDKRRIKE